MLSGKAVVTEETQRAVFAAADTLGYQYGKKSLILGFMAGSWDVALHTQPFVSEVLSGFEQSCRFHNAGLMYASLEGQERMTLEQMPVMILEQQVQGVALANVFDARVFDLLRELQLPFVSISHYLKGFNTDTVICDDEEGGYLATRYLLEKGHRSPPPAMLLSKPEKTSIYRRYLGYRRALDEFGIDFDPRYTYVDENSYARAAGGIKALFQLPEPPSAIFCGTDSTAMNAERILQQMGISVPEQCSLIGFDDIEPAAHCAIPLTTIHVDNRMLGSEAVRLLLTRIEQPGLPSRTLSIGVQLLERESVAPYTARTSTLVPEI